MEIDAIRAAAMPLLAALPVAAWLPHELIRKPDGKLDKPPCAGARSNDPKTWFTIDKALDLLAAPNNVAGIGFAITAGIIGLDYDDCRNPTTGELSAEVQQELERFNSYAYVTPSKTGIRIVGKNDPAHPIPGGKRVRYLPGGQKIEIFVGPTNFYNTFTSDLIDGYTALRDIYDDTLDYLEGLQGHTNDQTPPSSRVNGSGITPNNNPARSIEAIRATLAVIPNDHRDWDEWCRIGMATWRSSDGSQDGYDAWLTWSAKCSYHNPAECAERWQHWFRSPPTYAGFATLYHSARRANPLFVAPYDPVTEEARQETRQETPHDPETGEVYEDPTFAATPLSDLDLDHIPPRRWLYGRELVRGYVSVLASPGGVGKTAYTMAVGVSVAINRSLLNPAPMGKAPADCVIYKPGNVWFYNLEDPMEEMRRRIKATLQHHRVPVADVQSRIFIDSGRDRPLIIATRAQNGDLIASPIVGPLVAELKRRSISVLVVDPFVQSHSAEENRNEEMNLVMALWGKVANEADCAVWLVHHFRKGGRGGDAESIRGAGAIQGAARSMFTISAMEQEEASKLGVADDERWQYIRHDNAKQNMAPPAGNASWFRLASVGLDNGTDDYPDGDFVQAVESWTPPSPWGDMVWGLIERILTQLEQGPEPGEFYALGKQSKDRWAGKVIVEEACKTDGQATAILKAWKESGLIEDGQYASPRQKGGTTGCVRVNQAKFHEMKRDLGNSRNNPDA
jgi:hypothetical protein